MDIGRNKTENRVVAAAAAATENGSDRHACLGMVCRTPTLF